MPGIQTNRLRCDAASSYLQSLNSVSPAKNIYCYIGKTLPWQPSDDANDNSVVSDNSPPFPDDTDSLIFDIWKQMLHLKKISPADCTLVIRRFNWTLNTVYRQYDTTIDFFDPTLSMVPFYVITDEYNVYKCLYNNNNGPSYVKPTGTYTTQIKTADGYVWKFMYNISNQNAEKFVTNEWVPVQVLSTSDGSAQWDVQKAAVSGAISTINILNPGYGYITPPNLTILGDGTGASATCTIKNGSIYQILLSNIGKNYTFANVVVSSGQLTGIQILNPGSGYISAPAISITGGGGSGAAAIATVVNGRVVSITITNTGSNYTSTPTIIFSSPSSGVTAAGNPIVSGGVNLQVIVSPQGGHGSNAILELGGFTLLFTGQFQYDESGVFTVNNDFRQIGLLSNPIDNSTNQIATGTLYTQASLLQLSSNVTGMFIDDEVVTGSISGTSGIVLDYVFGTSNILRIVNLIGPGFLPGENISNESSTHIGKIEIATGNVASYGFSQVQISAGDLANTNAYKGFQIRIISGTGSGQQKTIISNDIITKIVTVDSNWSTSLDTSSVYSIANITSPGLEPYTGSILTVEDRQPIERSEQQTEKYGITVQF